MSDVTNHEPGTFCWFELTTSDPAASKRFYSELLNWSFEDMPTPNGTYTMARIRGRDAAAMMEMGKEQRAQGIPTYWGSYISVKSVDESAKKATSLGGKILMEPMDVMDAGRMAVLQDPSGAMFSIWQAGKHLGTGVEQEPGAFTWAELATRDVPACRDFYTKLFDWSVHGFEGGEIPYWLFNANDKDRGGMMALTDAVPAQVPAHWKVYFVVGDCDGSVNRAQSMGGEVVVRAMDVPNTGRFAVLRDPQGGVFGVLQQPSR